MEKVTLLAWIRTIRLLIKHRFNLEKTRQETDREITDTVSDKILKNAYKGEEQRNWFYRTGKQMLKKIISGGQTGADRAALDTAIKLKIPHGGWVPKGRLAEDGPLPDEYRLQEMPTKSYPARTEQNVIDSDRTLIIARGKLTGGSDYTRKMALMHKKQLLGIDLNQTNHYDAASLVASWIKLQRVEILNVAGPRASKDPDIYSDVSVILENAIQILIDEEKKSDTKPSQSKPSKPPKTVDEAVKRLISEMSLKDKTVVANMAEIELSVLHTTLSEYIRNEFGLWSGNEDLITSCRFFAKTERIREDDASYIIIRELWKRLKESHKLRVVEWITPSDPKNLFWS